MRQKGNAVVYGIIIVGILALIGFLLLGGKSIFDGPLIQDSPTNQQGKSVGEDSSDTLTDGRYVEFKSGTLEMYTDKRRVLYFYANWCPTCRPADANFKANESKIPEDVVVIRVNYNDSDTDSDEEQLATQYGITYQHTFVQIDAEGNEVTKWNGGEISELLDNIQ